MSRRKIDDLDTHPTGNLDIQKSAEEKFKKVQEAYETIKKERGMN
jgi:DnaJ-class molecular chaperone